VLLEVGTVTGAIVGYLIASRVHESFLYILFGCFLLASAALMLRRREHVANSRNHPWSQSMGLAGKYPLGGRLVEYGVDNVPFGLVAMFGAGILSALLGIGSGIFKVLAMDGAMKLPMKVSSATSNFMIGVTAAGSAGAYFASGDVRPEIAAPVAVGVLIGSLLGARAMPVIPAAAIRKTFVLVLSLAAVQMIREGMKGMK
jgi:uncharacterized membrane protein YfcA